MIDQAVVLLTVVATVFAARIAYRYGCRRATPRAPVEIIDELRVHKIRCLGEPPERVALELALLLGARERNDARQHEPRAVATHRGRAGARA